MKSYQVRVYYSGMESYSITAKDAETAQNKALEYFKAGEPGNGPPEEKMKFDIPTFVTVLLDGEVVALPPPPKTNRRSRRIASKKTTSERTK